jgi:hypothetical protein
MAAVQVLATGAAGDSLAGEGSFLGRPAQFERHQHEEHGQDHGGKKGGSPVEQLPWLGSGRHFRVVDFLFFRHGSITE